MVKASNARRLSIRQSFGGIMEEKPAIAMVVIWMMMAVLKGYPCCPSQEGRSVQFEQSILASALARKSFAKIPQLEDQRPQLRARRSVSRKSVCLQGTKR